MAIKTQRKLAGMTQRQLGEAVGVGKCAVCNWEKGKAYPTAATLIELAKLLGCTVDDLLKEE